jgi:hypothetical protein
MRSTIQHLPHPVLPANRQFRPRGILLPNKRLISPGDSGEASMLTPAVIA